MIVAAADRAAHINGLLGRPYRAGTMGPDAFDCYGLARHLQAAFFGRDLPVFQLPAEAGRFAVASAIAVHPERSRWSNVFHAVDGAIAVLARQDCGFHLGTYVAVDGGLIVHTLEQTGVLAERPFQLSGPAGRWHLKYYLPGEAAR